MNPVITYYGTECLFMRSCLAASHKTYFTVFSRTGLQTQIYHGFRQKITRNCSSKGTESEWRIIESKKQQFYRRSGPERIKTVKNSDLYRELTSYQEAGVQLWLNGKRSNSFRIADCVREKTDYMRDYYVDMENRVCGIGFDRIRKDNHGTAEIPYAKSLNNYEDFLKKSKYVRSRP